MANYVYKIINDEVIIKKMTEKAKNELSIYNWKYIKEKWEKNYLVFIFRINNGINLI